MILVALILAATGSCADRTACPSRAEVERALLEQHYERVSQLSDDLNPPGSDHTTLVPLVRTDRVAGIRCGRLTGKPRGVTCRATVYRYKTPDIVETVRLVRRHKRWEWEHSEGIYSH